jgi:hypothetical protein
MYWRMYRFSWHSSIGLPDGEAWFITPANALPLLQGSMEGSFTPLQPMLGIAHGDRRLAMHFSTLSSGSVSLCGLPLCGWAAVAPRHIYFTITAPTVDWGSSSSRAETWWTDLLERWHTMMVPRWKSLSSSVRPFYCQCLSMEIEWLFGWFYSPVSNGWGWNGRTHSFWVVHILLNV